MLVAGSPARQVVKGLSPRTRLALQFNPDGEIPDLVADCVDAAADELITAAGGPPRDRGGLRRRWCSAARAELPRLTADTVPRVEAVLTQAREVAVAIGAAPGRRVPDAAIADLRRQMGGLLHRGFVAATGRRRLPDVVRYLTRDGATGWRSCRPTPRATRSGHAAGGGGDRRVRAAAARRCPATGAPDDPVARVRWMVEELRVGLFAQDVGTPRPVSEQRVYKAIDALSPPLTAGLPPTPIGEVLSATMSARERTPR